MYKSHLQYRKAMRLKHYDYNQAGAYFITICIQGRECLLGNIQNGLLQLNEYGEIVSRLWNHLPKHFDDVDIDAGVVMPNHFHGIIVLDSAAIAKNMAEIRGELPFYEQKTKLGQIIAYFKYQTTKLINQKRDLVGVKVWQRNYYDHIIRNQQSLEILRRYIVDNPLRWSEDQLHPDNPSKW